MGPVASAAHHGMVMRMPGIPIACPMTPKEWTEAWDWFMAHDDPLYVSEHRRGFGIDYEMEPMLHAQPHITLVGISAGRLNAMEAARALAAEGIKCDMIHLLWLKPFSITDIMTQSLAKSGLGLVIDSDYEIGGPSRSIAYDLMHATSQPVFALGLEDRTGGFAPHLDNPTPPMSKIVEKVKALLSRRQDVAVRSTATK